MDHPTPRRRPRQLVPKGIGVLLAFLLVSGLVHLVSIVEMPEFSEVQKRRKLAQKSEKKKIAVKLVPKKKPAPKQDDPQKILETKLEKTKPPPKPTHKGAQDHIAKKETRIKPKPNMSKAQDPGLAQKKPPSKSKKPAQSPQSVPKMSIGSQKPPKQAKRKLVDPLGKVRVEPSMRRKFQTPYSALLPRAGDLREEVSEAYQEHVDETIELGDRIDINTSDYRFIGYFTAMRKSIELVWNYPSQAIRRGQQGNVGLEFTILKDGSVRGIKVLSTSGFQALDGAIVEAIKLASPFAPLPDGFGKKKLTITGNFRYVLSNFAAGH